MLNQAKEELNKLIQRLEMLFQIQTHEVVQDLKKIRELLNNPEEIQAPKTPKANKEEIKEEPKQEIVEDQTHEVEQKEVILPFQTEIDNKIE
jgi:flagellar biosynthesis regulator FlbT